MNDTQTPEWITLEDALKIEHRPNTYQLSRWMKRWNENPNTVNKIRRRHAMVEKNSLIAAQNEDETRFRSLKKIADISRSATRRATRTAAPSQQKGGI